MNDFNARIIEDFRAHGGKVGPPFEGAPMVLLHTTGAKTGKERVNPLVGLPQDDRVFVFASKGGAPTNPDWYHNLVAHPDVTVERGTETYEATARVVEGEERDRIYSEQARLRPQFGQYQAKTKRTIPVVALERKG